MGWEAPPGVGKRWRQIPTRYRVGISPPPLASIRSGPPPISPYEGTSGEWKPRRPPLEGDRRRLMTRHAVSGLNRRRSWWALVLVALVAGWLAMPVAANAAALTTVSWTVSNNQISATNVTYSYSFKTATTGTIKTITFAVSGAGLGGAPAIARSYGIPAGTVARAGQTITYTVTTAASVSANIPIYIEFSGLTNSGTAGAYTTNVTTQTAVPATIDGPTTSNSMTLAANN